MPPRTRSRITNAFQKGSRTVYNGTTSLGTLYGAGPGFGTSESMSDSTSAYPHPPQNMSYVKKEVRTLQLNGKSRHPTMPTYTCECINYNPDNRSYYSYAPAPYTINWDVLVTKALASMNPNKPSFDLPVFLFELKDFPGMLRDLGKLLYKPRVSDAAGTYLAYSFGWAPLFSDLKKLLDFGELFSDRISYLRKLSEQGGTRVARTIMSDESILSSGLYTIPAPYPFTQNTYEATYQVRRIVKAWFVARGKLEQPLPSNEELPFEAARAALGLNLSAASLWEALPWSWLVDYFANVGSYLDATRNNIAWSVKDMSVMCKVTQVNGLINGKALPGIEYKGGTMITVQKERQVFARPKAVLTYNSVLTEHQGLILSSLATAKALKALRV